MPRDFRRTFRLNRRSDHDARASVEEELTFHLEEAQEELVEAGWIPEDARLEVLRRFGDLEESRAVMERIQTKRGREERRAMSLDDLWQDVRYAVRTLRRSPGYAALVVLTLTFGIAANTTIFSAMNPYLLRPLPYADPDALVQVNQANPVTGWDMDRFSYPQVLDWQERTHAFEDMGAYQYGVANITGPEGPEQVQYSSVTANLFGDVLGVEPFLGRGFTAAEGRPGGDPVVLLGASLWQRRYQADPEILGRTITLDGVQYTVVGVMPQSFNFPFGTARLWLPLRQDATVDRGRMNLQIVARLRDGWTAERARADLLPIQTELAALHPEADGRMAGVTVKPLREALNFAWDAISTTSMVLLGAVVFVLLIACVNVAGLSLARGSARSREMAVRGALGAGRGRLVRQLLTESLILAVAGGVLGVLVANAAVGLIAPVLPEELYRVGDMTVDGTVLAFSVAITMLTPLAFGLWPAVAAARARLTAGLKEGSRGATGSGTRGRSILVVAQVALAVVLITGAGLMLRSLAAIQDVDLGFEPHHLVVTEAILPTNDYPSAQERLAYVDRAVEALARTPGVASASAVTWLPLNHESITVQVTSSDRAGAPAESWPLAV
ncbi:MAG: ABC transporter permease, partial [Gemmatimonadota bacterium]